MENSDKEELQNLREEVKQLREQTEKNGNNIIKKIMIGLIPLIIAASFSSYLGVVIAAKVDRQKIIHNSKSIIELKEENERQWDYIIDFAATRGEKINLKKDE